MSEFVGLKSIASGTIACFEKFGVCIKAIDGSVQIHLNNRLADLRLWADSVGALSDGAASLDAKLSQHPDDLLFVAEFLSMLEQFLENCSKAFNDDHALQESITDIDTMIENLAWIGMEIQRAGTKSRLNRFDRSFKAEDHAKLRAHLVCLIESHSPEEVERREDAKIWRNEYYSKDHFQNVKLEGVQARLVEANLRRRHRFLKAQERSIISEVSGIGGSSNLNLVVYPSVLDTVPEDAETGQKLPAPKIPGQAVTEWPIPSTKQPLGENIASSKRASTLDSQFQGLRKVKPIGVAMSKITTITGAMQLPIPTFPKTDGKEQPQQTMLMKCPCCCQVIPAPKGDALDSEKEQWLAFWKKHIATDISPYTCMLEECPSEFTFFITQKEWRNHVLKDHSPKWRCYHCEEELAIFRSLPMFIAHVKEHHPHVLSDQSLASLLSASTIRTLGITRCPLCDNKDYEDTPELVEHVLEHVYEFSVRSLPWPQDSAYTLQKPVHNFTTDFRGSEWVVKWLEDAELLDQLELSEDSLRKSKCKLDDNPPCDSEFDPLDLATVDYFSLKGNDYFADESDGGDLSRFANSSGSRSSKSADLSLRASIVSVFDWGDNFPSTNLGSPTANNSSRGSLVSESSKPSLLEEVFPRDFGNYPLFEEVNVSLYIPRVQLWTTIRAMSWLKPISYISHIIVEREGFQTYPTGDMQVIRLICRVGYNESLVRSILIREVQIIQPEDQEFFPWDAVIGTNGQELAQLTALDIAYLGLKDNDPLISRLAENNAEKEDIDRPPTAAPSPTPYHRVKPWQDDGYGPKTTAPLKLKAQDKRDNVDHDGYEADINEALDLDVFGTPYSKTRGKSRQNSEGRSPPQVHQPFPPPHRSVDSDSYASSTVSQHHLRRVRSEPDFDPSESTAATTHDEASELMFAQTEDLGRQRSPAGSQDQGSLTFTALSENPQSNDTGKLLACRAWRNDRAGNDHKSCKQGYENESRLFQHERRRHNIFRCIKCLTKFPIEDVWKHHRAYSPYLCSTCSSCFNTKAARDDQHNCNPARKVPDRNDRAAFWQRVYEEDFDDGVHHDPYFRIEDSFAASTPANLLSSSHERAGHLFPSSFATGSANMSTLVSSTDRAFQLENREAFVPASTGMLAYPESGAHRIKDEQRRKKEEEERALDIEEMRTRARLDDRARMREEAKAKRDAEGRKRAEEDRLREEHEAQREEALRKAKLQHEQAEEERKAKRDGEETERIKRQILEGRDREEGERERQARLDAEERRLRDIEAKQREDRERERQARLQREREARLEAEQRRLRDLELQEQAERDREERAQLERERQARLDAEERRLQDLDAQMQRFTRDSIPPRAPSPCRPRPTTYASNRLSGDLQQTLDHYEQLEAQISQRIHDSDLRRAEHDYEYLDRRVRERQLHHAGPDRIDGPLFGARRNIDSSPLPSPTLRAPVQAEGRGEGAGSSGDMDTGGVT